jgi:peptidoglycan/LPS O-acetylase OafA/YrhL
MFFYQKISPSISMKLDIARSISASIVALGHVRGGFFQAYDHLTLHSQNPINFLLFFLTRLGHEAVIIFFVLSGYLVGGAFLSEYLKEETNWTKYLINRIARMWTVLLPALIVGGFCDYISIIINPAFPAQNHLNIPFF